jgi:hypothetical protein
MTTMVVVVFVVAPVVVVVVEVDSTRYVLAYRQLIRRRVNCGMDISCPLLVVTLAAAIIGNRTWVPWGQMRDIMVMGMVEGIVVVVVVLTICGIKAIGLTNVPRNADGCDWCRMVLRITTMAVMIMAMLQHGKCLSCKPNYAMEDIYHRPY